MRVSNSPSVALVINVASIAALKQQSTPADGTLAFVRDVALQCGDSTGYFRFSRSAANTPDDVLVVAASGATGRWLRLYSGLLNVRWFGAVGDGTVDDTTAFTTAITAASTWNVPLLVPAGSYVISSKLTIPANVLMRGAGKLVTTLLHAYNGDFADVGGSAGLYDLTIDGQGATYTGKGLYFSGSNGAQSVSDVRVINFASACLYFEYGAGSRARFTRLDAYCYNGGTGTGNYAIVIDPAQQLAAKPRSFVQLDTSGNCGFDFGGCNDVHISASTFGDCNFTADSRGVNMSASRWLNQTACTINGHNNSIVGCDINPSLSIASGADIITLGPGSFNHLPITDSSGNDRNNVTHGQTTYTPSLTSGGTAPSLGNGVLNGRYVRAGAIISVTINLTLGSTTTLGTGELRFSLPVSRINSTIETCGGAVMLSGSTNYTGMVQIPGNVSYCRIIRDGTGAATATSPATFTSGDTIRLTFTYTL